MSLKAVAGGFARSLALFDAGLIVGVSFIATPVKFMVDELTTPELLLVGRVTFGVFGWVELALAVLLVAATLLARRPRRSIVIAMGVLLTVVGQILVLQPILADRVTALYAGQEPPPSPWHTMYAGLEAAKVVALVVMSQLRPR